MEDVFGRLGEILKPHIHKGNSTDMCGCVYVKELYKYGYVSGTDPSEALNKYLSDKKYQDLMADFNHGEKEDINSDILDLALCISICKAKGDTEMEQIFQEAYDKKVAQFDLLNEAERNGDDIIVKKIVDDIFELDDYTLLPTEQTKINTNE